MRTWKPGQTTICKNCGEKIELVNFALGPQWRHWPTPEGNYRVNEMYTHCKTSKVAEPPDL